jgi:hypothetical protein
VKRFSKEDFKAKNTKKVIDIRLIFAYSGIGYKAGSGAGYNPTACNQKAAFNLYFKASFSFRSPLKTLPGEVCLDSHS